MSESEIQKHILHYLNSQADVFAWRNQSTGMWDGKSFRRKGGFDIKGVSDILGICCGHLLAIEVKSLTGKPSEHQVAFINKINRMGGYAIVANNITVVEELLGRIRRDNGKD